MKPYTKAQCPRCGTVNYFARPQRKKENCHKCFMQTNGKQRIPITPIHYHQQTTLTPTHGAPQQ